MITSFIMLNAYGCQSELRYEEECDSEQRGTESEDENSGDEEDNGKTEIETDPVDWSDVDLDTSLG